MASAFVGKYASIAADLTQWKLDFRDSTEARFEII